MHGRDRRQLCYIILIVIIKNVGMFNDRCTDCLELLK